MKKKINTAVPPSQKKNHKHWINSKHPWAFPNKQNSTENEEIVHCPDIEWVLCASLIK